MFSISLLKSLSWMIVRSLSTKPSSSRPVSPILLFNADTKAVFGAQRMVRTARCRGSSELDLICQNSSKAQFEKETDLLYGGSTGFRRACSVAKGAPISERSRYVRDLFRIPRGQRISLFPQAYVPTKQLGLRIKKNK